MSVKLQPIESVGVASKLPPEIIYKICCHANYHDLHSLSLVSPKFYKPAQESMYRKGVSLSSLKSMLAFLHITSLPPNSFYVPAVHSLRLGLPQYLGRAMTTLSQSQLPDSKELAIERILTRLQHVEHLEIASRYGKSGCTVSSSNRFYKALSSLSTLKSFTLKGTLPQYPHDDDSWDRYHDDIMRNWRDHSTSLDSLVTLLRHYSKLEHLTLRSLLRPTYTRLPSNAAQPIEIATLELDRVDFNQNPQADIMHLGAIFRPQKIIYREPSYKIFSDVTFLDKVVAAFPSVKIWEINSDLLSGYEEPDLLGNRLWPTYESSLCATTVTSFPRDVVEMKISAAEFDPRVLERLPDELKRLYLKLLVGDTTYLCMTLDQLLRDPLWLPLLQTLTIDARSAGIAPVQKLHSYERMERQEALKYAAQQLREAAKERDSELFLELPR